MGLAMPFNVASSLSSTLDASIPLCGEAGTVTENRVMPRGSERQYGCTCWNLMGGGGVKGMPSYGSQDAPIGS